MDNERKVVIIGGGPAGLTAGYELTNHNIRPMVLEKSDKVGGIARTDEYKGFRFDMGGHRFFTKAEEVNRLWREVLGTEFLRRPRLSRIYYKRKFFNYPLKPQNVVKGLGILESFLIICSYLRWQILPFRQEETFEQWVTNRFGRRLFLTFFKTYTEKVWGIPCSELKAEWAAQRIKDLSVKSLIISMFFKPKKTIKTLIEEFEYPRLGPGMMWEAFHRAIENRRGTVRLNSDVVRIRRNGKRIEGIAIRSGDGEEEIVGTDYISSMPVTEFIKKLDPPAPPEVLDSAGKLTYRDFLTVCLIIDKEELFPDNWIYIHEPGVQVGRIQNFKNWSPDMVPDQSKTSLGLEYFCTEGDDLWTRPDDQLIEQAKQEVERIGLAQYKDCEDGCVVRVPKAYPVYDADYRNYLAVVRDFVNLFENFQTVGRNGLHRYNNQDHAMLTGIYAVRNLVLGEKNDLWDVNTDQEYHEEVEDRAPDGLAPVPRPSFEGLLGALSTGLPRLNRQALGAAVGTISACVLALATAILCLRGGEHVGAYLSLLGQYFPGYQVSWTGVPLGLFYGFVVGFIGGWSYALLRNMTIFLLLASMRRSVERQALRQLFEFV